MQFSKVEVRAERNIWRNAITILMRATSSQVVYLLKPIWEEVKEDPRIHSPKDEYELYIPEDTAQNLMDELWNCGLRPSEGTGSAGSLRATENHLSDMQKLSWRLLDMIDDKEKS